MNSNTVWIYIEKQGTDRLCGVHCLNSLLQGPFYTELSLAEIARELDSKEKELVMEQGVDSKDYLTYMAEESNNVADDGNYNIQVLSEALKRVGELTCDSIDSSDLKNRDLSGEDGFICNSSNHWFAVRKINNIWYNLNSTNRDGPEVISDFYLSAFLNSIRENGYIIFAIHGNYPQYDKSFFGETLPHQRWFTDIQCRETHERNLKKKNYKLNIGGTDERDLEEAIANSLKEAGKSIAGNQQNNARENDDEYEKAIQNSLKEEEGGFKNRMDQEPEDKFQAFKGTGISLGAGSHGADLESFHEKWNASEDPELAFCLKLSMSEQFVNRPEVGPDTIQLNIRFFTGKVESWVFYKNTVVEELYNFVKVNLPDDMLSTKFRISTTYPKKHLVSMGDSLGALGIEDQDTLVVEKL